MIPLPVLGFVLPNVSWGAVALVAMIGFAGAADEWGKGKRKEPLAIVVFTAVMLGVLAGLLSWIVGVLAIAALFLFGTIQQINAWKQGKVRETLREFAWEAVFIGGLCGYGCWLLHEGLATGQITKENMTPEEWDRLPMIIYVLGGIAALCAVFLVSLGVAVLAAGPKSRQGND